MLSPKRFITMSIDLNLFFLRIMKEHSLFLELGFTPRDKAMGAQAARFRIGFEELLADTIELANGNVSNKTLRSGEIATQYTKEAERLTSFYTGVPINSSLTDREQRLVPTGKRQHDASLVNEIEMLDRRAYQLTAELAKFKERLLANVLSCKMFTVNYPLLIDHILREAELFMSLLAALVRGENIMRPEDIINHEMFWNRIMAEHAKFIAGLLDPTEEDLIDTARDFGREFDTLTAQAIQATNQAVDISRVTYESLEETRKIRDFKATGTKGLIECKVKSIMVPLLGDHVLREANHYLCILGVCEPAQ